MEAQKFMLKRTLFTACTLATALGLFVACSDNPTVQKNVTPATPQFSATVPANGTGQCMGEDGVASGFVSGFTDPTTLNCTSNDIDIAFATVTEYSFTSATGPFTALPQGQSVECTGGQQIYVRTHAFLVNNAQERFDIGVWIATDGGNAQTGTCNHYNLIPGQGGSTSLEVPAQADQCGDMSAGVQADVDLDVLTLTCPTNGSSALSVGACVGWQNSDDFQERGTCPTSPPGGSLGFRYGTVPETKAKCNCEPFTLPVIVKASLTLVKVVTNNSGGTKSVSDFPLTATGPQTISGVSGTTAVTARPVTAGTYALTEQTQTGYTASSWSCSGGTQSGANITLSTGGAATCTISNDDQAASLTLVKVVTNNNGGTKSVSDFPLTATGPTTISGVSGTTAVTGRSVNAGTYALTEQAQSGYSASTWSCSGGTQSGANITLGLAGSATCTISNDDQPSTLTLVKVVTNNSGGTKTLSDFPLTATGPTTISGVSGTTAVTSRGVNAGTYALTETTVAGYTPSTWSCSGGTQSGANITIGLNTNATCTISNDDQAATLTLVKVVTNNNGGTKTLSDFPLTATGPTSINGVSGTTAVTGRSVNAGTYALTEQTQTGYTASTWSCSGGTQSGANITLGLAGAATCTISNDDQPATLTLKKVVIGDGATFNFTLTGSGLPGTQALSPASNSFAQQVYTGLSAGSKSITELLTTTGYTLTDLGCTRGGVAVGGPYDPLVTQTVSVTLTLNDNVICTFTNEQQVGQTTRTQGFWQTHLSLAWATWSLISDKTICTHVIDTQEKLMGGFWSSIAMTYDPKAKRSDLDQARMRLLQQLLAAMLNHQAFGSSPTGGISIAQAETALCGTDIDAINAAAAAMAAFNESGDTLDFTPGQSANAKQARTIADLGFWDVLP